MALEVLSRAHNEDTDSQIHDAKMHTRLYIARHLKWSRIVTNQCGVLKIFEME